jgi:translocation and assembly module TamB
VTSNQIPLEQFQSLVKDRPGLGGRLSLVADLSATIEPGGFQLTSLNTNLSAQDLRMEGRDLGGLTATASTAGNTLIYRVNSDFAGSTIQVNGRSLLTGDHQTTATANIDNLPIERVLAVAGRRDIPVSGMFGGDVQVSGTLQNPAAGGEFTITNATAYREKFDRLQANVSYDSQTIAVRSLRFTAGPSALEASATFTHPPNDFDNGNLQFRVRSNRLDLARFQTVRRLRPGLAGTLEVAADGLATLRQGTTPLFSTLNANVAVSDLALNGTELGDIKAVAETRGGDLMMNLESNVAQASVRGSGRMQLAGDYPLSAELKFANLTWSGLNGLLGTTRRGFEGLAEGRASLSGPGSRPQELRGMLEVTRLEARSVAPPGFTPRAKFEIHNQGPLLVTLDRSTVAIKGAHLVGTSTELTLTGTMSLNDPRTLNLRADGEIQLDVLEAFQPDIFSTGRVVLAAGVTGSLAKPVVNGRLTLQDAAFNMIDFPNGLSNANGTILFTGTEAIIEDLTGETGGGKVTLAGFVGYGGPEVQFRLEATANRIRVSYPQNVSTEASARLNLAGTTGRSVLSGTVTILDIALQSRTDFGSVLTQAATPPRPPTTNTGLTATMRLDVDIETAPGVQFRTTLAQNLQADARLELRGTPSRPGMLGRVNITQGEIVFFGSRYTIDQGTIAFYNPNRVEPILNVDLTTAVKGVNVALSVSGPMERLKLTYRSEPPLQFSEIVSLLATGKVPTSDPVLAARQPPAPEQSFEQVGASALLGQAVANPVSGRLQRLFGVSKLKIDPLITGAENTPQATMTLEQQITRELTLTYIQDVTESNPQTIRVEWTIDETWSAIAQRQQNGEIGVDLFYKKRFW